MFILAVRRTWHRVDRSGIGLRSRLFSDIFAGGEYPGREKPGALM